MRTKERDNIPGTWLDVDEASYQRLVRLARRRLVGYEHLAEDVVSRAAIKWSRLPVESQGRARIETVIRSEAYSMVRAEARLRRREARAASDRALGVAGDGSDLDMTTVRLAVVDAGPGGSTGLSALDVEVFELLVAGYTVADVERLLGVPRHRVKRSRERLRVVVSAALFTTPDQT